MKNSKRTSRRQMLRIGAAALGGGLLGRHEAEAAESPGKLGIPLGPYGERSPYEKAVRWTRQSRTPETGSSFTPLADSVGTLTPSSLHYERHHSGIPTIDPAQHRLIIHGMVDRPLSLSVADIKRLPSIFAHDGSRVRRQQRIGMGRNDRAGRSAQLRSRQL